MNRDLGLDALMVSRTGKSKRESSYDRTGGNKDYFTLEAGTITEFCHIGGSGIIRHIWMTMAPRYNDSLPHLPRKVVLRVYWDDETTPSIEAPIGDFFGMGHGMTQNFVSAPFAMSPQDGKAFNCFFPMPFEKGMRATVENNAEAAVKFYFYVDYEEDTIASNLLRFHAHWHREKPTDGISDQGMENAEYCFGGKNTTGNGNYVILEAEGKGHYVGCNMNTHNLRMTQNWNWYGEGDDMIFIDGEKWPPSLHGTGTEDYFNTAWCPTQEYCSPYHGLIMGGGPNWSGKVTYYRYHIVDPVLFDQSIKVTIEHGHNNHRCDDLSSTAYWYQTEPHKAFAPILPVEDRLPIRDITPLNQEKVAEIFSHNNP